MFFSTPESGQFSYQFKKPSGQMLKTLKNFKHHGEEYESYLKKRVIFDKLKYTLIGVTVLGSIATLDHYQHTATIIWYIAFGVLATFIFENAKAILQKKSNADLPVFIFLTLMALGFLAYFTYILLTVVWGELRLLHPQSPRLDLAKIIVGSIAGNFVLPIYRSSLRFKQTKPQPFELRYIISTLQPLLGELPKKEKCEISFNPFSHRWSQKERSGTRIDSILRFSVKPERDSTLKLVVDHYLREKRNGYRKLKGYRHVVKTCLFYKNPVVGKLDPESAAALQSKLELLLKRTRVSKNSDQSLGMGPKLAKISVKIKESQVKILCSYKQNQSSSKLEPSYLLHPEIVHKALMYTTATVASINTSIAEGQVAS